MCRTHAGWWYPDSRAQHPAPVDADRPATDVDREAASSQLRNHFTSGRLDIDEFSARLDEVWRASATSDLTHALRDLPPVPGGVQPWAAPDATVWPTAPVGWDKPSHRGHGVARSIARAHVHTFVSVMTLLVAIWALTGFGYFWPIWPLLFWGFVVFRHSRWTHRRYADSA